MFPVPAAGRCANRSKPTAKPPSAVLRNKLEERDIPVQTLLMFSDDIARAILNTAVEREVSLIVLGLTGKNVFARLLAGNVPVELIKNTHDPGDAAAAGLEWKSLASIIIQN